MEDISFSNEWVGEQVLRCPECNEDYLHHYKTEIFSRNEDEKIGLQTTIEKNTCETMLSRMEKNPSSRRDGIRIKFSCEMCQASMFLTISQHKGQTFIKWIKE